MSIINCELRSRSVASASIANCELITDVLVVGGGTGGTAAAIQAARQGAKTILVSEFPWLGGMLTSAGVSAPDGNELVAFQTGMWGAFLRELQHRQVGGLDSSWVSFFSFDPRLGAQIFADWVKELPCLDWIAGQVPQAVLRVGDRITGVQFADFTVTAKITLDATEQGDLLALAEVPHRWGWEWQSQSGEPSAPTEPNSLTEKYPVQAPTWVVIMQDFGDAIAPEIPAPPQEDSDQFVGAWDGYTAEQFLNYGRLPGGLYMINWPQCGNDYGEGLGRLIASQEARYEFLQQAFWHTQSFARFIQTQLGRRYGLAEGIFPVISDKGQEVSSHQLANNPNHSSFALHPYYRESRRVVGVTTVREQDILPLAGGRVAPLPVDAAGRVTGIAIGNYANDHHYPGIDFQVRSKSIRWGGRWTGTPFTLPYGCLIPAAVDGLLVCEKNISVSHIANGATRLQPVVMGIGQAAGMAAALCVARGCQPRDLSVRDLQSALLQDDRFPTAIIPLFNLPGDCSDWLHWQHYYLNHPEAYPPSGNCPDKRAGGAEKAEGEKAASPFSGIFHRRDEQDYSLSLTEPVQVQGEWTLVTLRSHVDEQLQTYPHQQPITVSGRLNHAGQWLLVEQIVTQR